MPEPPPIAVMPPSEVVAYADQFAGVDTAAKIAAAIASLPSTGGVVDAQAFQGANTWSSNPFDGVTKPVWLLTGPATFTWDTASMVVYLPSHFVWQAAGTTVRSSAPYVAGNTSGAGGLLNNRTYATTGNIAAGDNTLIVETTAGLEPGSILGISGAAGGQDLQSTTIRQAGGISADGNSITVAGTSGWNTAFGAPHNYLMIDSEIVSYGGGTGTAFTGVARGVFGTTATSHSNGTRVSAVPFFLSRVTGVAGNSITLADRAAFTVSNAYVLCGAQDIHLLGSLTLDGNSDGATQRGLRGIVWTQAANTEVDSGVVVTNFDGYGVFLLASSGNYVAGHYLNNSIKTGQAWGADIAIFESSHSNSVHSAMHQDGNAALLIDDRSTHWVASAGESNHNSVILGPVIGADYGPNSGQSAVAIEGCSYNSVYVPSMKPRRVATVYRFFRHSGLRIRLHTEMPSVSR